MLRKIILAGFAIFAMIFGSGNIVFPLIIGKDFASNWGIANLGWLIATVIVPLVGYYGAMIFDASADKYLRPIGKHATMLFMFLVMLMLGPFGSVTRGVNVSFGGIHIASPEISEALFNTVFCLITVILAWNPGKLVQMMGIVFTPLKFGGIAIVVLGALYFCNVETPISDTSRFVAFTQGLEVGYQTMDLLAAFVMSSSIYYYIKNSLPEHKRDDKDILLKFCGGACFVGAIVLTIVYTGLVYVGAKYSSLLQNTPDEALFTKIAEVAMGNYASWFVAIVIALCCLATNVVITSAFTDYIHKDVLKERGKRPVILLSVGAFVLTMSFLGFAKLCSLLGSILSTLYPGLIIFVVARIVYYYAKKGQQNNL